MFDRISFDRHILNSRAYIRGMRIPVSVVVGQIAYGATVGEVLAEYPDLVCCLANARGNTSRVGDALSR